MTFFTARSIPAPPRGSDSPKVARCLKLLNQPYGATNDADLGQRGKVRFPAKCWRKKGGPADHPPRKNPLT